jgi:uncharacterized membrane protein
MDAHTIVYKKAQHGVFEYFSQGLEFIKGRYWLFFGITVVGILLGSMAPLAILMGPMMCGVYLCFRKKTRGEEIKFEFLFKGFDYFLESFLATLIWFGFMLAVALPLVIFFIFNIGGLVYAFQQGIFPIQLVLIGLLCLLVLLSLWLFCFMAVPIQFAYILIVDRNLKSWDAVKTAFKACWFNFFKTTGLGLTVMLLSLAGMCCCYIGVLFLQPVIFGAYFAAYHDVFEPPSPPPMPNI